MDEFIILFALVLAINLLPAFGPPTWSVIVLYGIASDLPVFRTVLVAALAAALGRFLLALGFRALGDRIPEKMRRNLVHARRAIESRKRATLLTLGLFVLSPLPSAQLFEAAGLARFRLLPFTAAFFAGRIVSYAIYAEGAHRLRSESLTEAFLEPLRSPLGIGVQLAAIAGLLLLVWVDWERFGTKYGRGPARGRVPSAESPSALQALEPGFSRRFSAPIPAANASRPSDRRESGTVGS